MSCYQYLCDSCNHEKEVEHRMSECNTIVIECERCGTKMHRIPQSLTHQDGFMAIHNEPVWYSNLAEKMPYGRQDPKAMFTTRSAALDYAKRLADKNGGSIERV